MYRSYGEHPGHGKTRPTASQVSQLSKQSVRMEEWRGRTWCTPTRGQKLTASRRAHRRYVEVRKANALCMQLVKVRCFQNRIAVNGKFAVALVVSHHDDDVGLLYSER